MSLGCGCVDTSGRPQSISFAGLGVAAPAWTSDPSLVLGYWETPDRGRFVVTAENRGREEEVFGPGTFTPAEQRERWDMKGDLIAGGVALALPIGYDYLAPKKWPQLKMWHRVLVVVVGYFGASYLYRKL